MRHRFQMLFLLILMICTFSFLKVKGNEMPLVGKVIYLDAVRDRFGKMEFSDIFVSRNV